MEELKVVAGYLGYTGKVVPLPAKLVGKRKAYGFLKWVTKEVESCMNLSGESKRRFEEMKGLGKCFDETQLQQELTKARLKQKEHIQQLKQDVGRLQEEAPLKEHLQSLNHIHERLSLQYEDCLHDKEMTLKCFSECQREYDLVTEQLKANNDKMNSALLKVQTSAEQLLRLYQSQDTRTTSNSTHKLFLSSLSQNKYHDSENELMKQLTKYAKKQFFPGIADMVQTLSDKTQCTILDLTETDNITQSSDEVYLKHKQELERLQSILPICESQHINHVIMTSYAKAAAKRAEEEIKKLEEKGKQNINMDTLGQQIQMTQNSILDVRHQMQLCVDTRLTPLLQDRNTLLVTRVLHGDYDLKLARQNYFTSKQHEIIKRLQRQRARQALLSMLLEVELRHHRNNHQLILATSSQLEKWQEDYQQRKVILEKALKTPVNIQQTAVTYTDRITISLCQLMEITPHQTSPVISYDSLLEGFSQMKKLVSVKEAENMSRTKEQEEMIEKLQLLFVDIQNHIFREQESTKDKPLFTPKVFNDSVLKLETLLGTLEQNIKYLLKEHEEKHKILQCSALLEIERSLFVYFFIQPKHLSEVMSELNQKIDSRIALDEALSVPSEIKETKVPES